MTSPREPSGSQCRVYGINEKENLSYKYHECENSDFCLLPHHNEAESILIKFVREFVGLTDFISVAASEAASGY